MSLRAHLEGMLSKIGGRPSSSQLFVCLSAFPGRAVLKEVFVRCVRFADFLSAWI